MKDRLLKWSMALSAIVLLLGSCTKEPVNNLSEEESRIYITNSNPSAQFSNYKTYSIVDSVAVISDNRLEGKAVTAYDVQLISSLKEAMQQRGFTLVDKSAHPDLGINVSRITNTYTGVVSYPNYWSGYNDYYDPFYWGYPGYGYYSPYSYGVYQSSEGLLSVDMLDLKNASGNQITAVWTALARGSGVFKTSNVSSQIQAFFGQSPYLKASN
jgi:hypothetical protein